MELMEVAVIFINAAAMDFGYSAVLYSIVFLLSRQRISFFRVYLLLYILSIITSFTVIAYLPIVFGITSFFYLYIHNRNVFKNILVCFLTVVIFFVLMSLNSMIVLMFNISAERILELRHTLYYNIYNAIIFIIFSIVSVLIISGISNRLNNTNVVQFIDKKYSNSKLVIFVSISILFFLVVITSIWMIAFIDTENGLFYTAFGITMSLLLGAFAIYAVYTNISMMAQKSREYEIQHNMEMAKLYKKEIQDMYTNVRDFKHDYMKIYSSMCILLENNNIEELKKFFYTSIIPLQDDILKNTNAVHTISKIENEIIQGVIYNYVLKAKTNGIDFNININDDIPDTPEVSAVDLARILGIFLDNAFESAEKTKEKDVSFYTVKNKNNIVYIIKNRCDTPPNLSKIFDESYSVKGKNRGRGMAIAKKLINKYQNVYLNVSVKSSFYIIQMSIFI